MKYEKLIKKIDEAAKLIDKNTKCGKVNWIGTHDPDVARIARHALRKR